MSKTTISDEVHPIGRLARQPSWRFVLGVGEWRAGQERAAAMAEQQQQQGAAVSAAAAAAGEPTQVHSDAALLDFLSSLLDYTPTVSDTNFFGFPSSLFSLAFFGLERSFFSVFG